MVIILQERANIDNSAFSKTKTLLSFKVADALYATACGDGHVLLKVSGIHASFLKLLTILKDMQQLLLLAGGECHSMAIAATSYIVFIKWHSKLITWCSKTGCLLICSAWPSLACLCRDGPLPLPDPCPPPSWCCCCHAPWQLHAAPVTGSPASMCVSHL